jgi:hypothetical protein
MKPVYRLSGCRMALRRYARGPPKDAQLRLFAAGSLEPVPRHSSVGIPRCRAASEIPPKFARTPHLAVLTRLRH